MFATSNVFAPTTAATNTTLIAQIKRMAAVHKQRKALAKMDAAQMHDLGLTDQMVAVEIARPFWDI